jgi:hypothetical protein
MNNEILLRLARLFKIPHLVRKILSIVVVVVIALTPSFLFYKRGGGEQIYVAGR